MIITEQINISGNTYIHNYSDLGLYIERDGIIFSDAIDPIGTDRVYEETDTIIERDEDDEDI